MKNIDKQIRQKLLNSDEEDINIPKRNYSFSRSKIQEYRSSGIYFEKRKTIKKKQMDSPDQIIFTSLIEENNSEFYQDKQDHQNNNNNQVLKQIENLERSNQSFYTCHESEQQTFKKNQENLIKNIQKQNIKIEDNTQINRSKLPSVMTSTDYFQPSQIIHNAPKQIKYIKKKLDWSRKKQEQLSMKQRIYRFFGQGINLLILHLSVKVINILIYNVIIDISFRIALTWICFQCYLLSNYNNYFFFPLYAEILSRILMFFTLIKMSFDQKNEVSRSFQKAINNKSYVDIQMDRVFMRQYDYKNIAQTIVKCMVLPQIIIIAIEGNQCAWKKIYFLVNIIFKSIQNFFVLLSFSLVLLSHRSQTTFEIPHRITIISVSIIIQEIVRFVLNYLIINTLSLAK